MYWNVFTPPIVSVTSSWIVTLDVLKSDRVQRIAIQKRLNSNIRCIEIRVWLPLLSRHNMLNSNIRCIEILNKRKSNHVNNSWIVTLDVLKCSWSYEVYWLRQSWIVTLDVLK